MITIALARGKVSASACLPQVFLVYFRPPYLPEFGRDRKRKREERGRKNIFSKVRTAKKFAMLSRR